MMRYLIKDEDLKKILLEAEVVDEKKFDDILRNAKQEGISMPDAAVSQGVVSSEELAKLIADSLDIPFINLSGNLPSKDVLSVIPEIVARKKHILPFKKDSQGLHLAMANPGDLEIINFIERKEGVPVRAYMATEQDIDAALELYGKALGNILKETFEKHKELEKDDNKKASQKTALSIIEITKSIILQAYRNRASDIHIEPRSIGNSIVRFRIDGVLHDVADIPRELHPQIISRIKVMARLRTDEHQTPQDGKISFSYEDEKLNIDIRVSVVPVTDGEKIVMRILSERSRQFSLTNVGLDDEDLKKVKAAYKKPYGLILSTGPTGCGKTTTLYAILKMLNKRQVNIMTIEDPVEYDIEGVSQIQVNSKAKLTFATGLRSILRQDPDIIFVGEIRDKETAGIAVNLALTGHLVLSTLHTNDSATAIPRFVDLGIEPFLVASTVSVVIAQRLIREIHDNCRISQETLAYDLAEKIGWEMVEKKFGIKKTEPNAKIRLYYGKGCESCQGTGYKGRVGIFEVMVMNDEIRKLIIESQDATDIQKLSVQSGMRTMLEDGLNKVNLGITTIDEVLGAIKL
jgi:type II secretory ATPase GspE/PulE/Tfp pilus assembly ATPase PilB-like protein